ncbi:hypothetical protein IWZ00DRAFT_58132 [Phyllosticta capitalensis]
MNAGWRPCLHVKLSLTTRAGNGSEDDLQHVPPVPVRPLLLCWLAPWLTDGGGGSQSPSPKVDHNHFLNTSPLRAISPKSQHPLLFCKRQGPKKSAKGASRVPSWFALVKHHDSSAHCFSWPLFLAAIHFAAAAPHSATTRLEVTCARREHRNCVLAACNTGDTSDCMPEKGGRRGVLVVMHGMQARALPWTRWMVDARYARRRVVFLYRLEATTSREMYRTASEVAWRRHRISGSNTTKDHLFSSRKPAVPLPPLSPIISGSFLIHNKIPDRRIGGLKATPPRKGIARNNAQAASVHGAPTAFEQLDPRDGVVAAGAALMVTRWDGRDGEGCACCAGKDDSRERVGGCGCVVAVPHPHQQVSCPSHLVMFWSPPPFSRSYPCDPPLVVAPKCPRSFGKIRE